MKVLQINIFGNLSTGRIAVDIYRTLRNNGHEGMVAFSRNTIADDVPHFKFGSKLTVYSDVIMTRLTDRAGFYSKGPTKKLIEKIKEYDPDIIHLHNIHGYYLNIELLFNFLKEYGKPVVWTLHDCWAFTGHCCNFEYARCNKWKNGCGNCQQKSNYPASFVDKSRSNYEKKKKLFTSIDNMILVTPSIWLKKLVEESFMSKFRIKVIRNGVDLNVFKPTFGEWVKRNNLTDKEIILGVAGTWSPTKGLSDMVKLSELLPSNYQVVIVGLNKKQMKSIPDSVFAIERTYNSQELAEIYTAAKVFINPSYDDNFPNVNLEALACGTPVITYQTGGGPEIINDKIGAVVPQGSVEELIRKIENVKKNSNECISVVSKLDRSKQYMEYLRLYNEINK